MPYSIEHFAYAHLTLLVKNNKTGQLDPKLIEAIYKTPWLREKESKETKEYSRKKLINEGLNAINELVKTADGNEFLLQFLYDHPEVRGSVFMNHMNLKLIHNKLDRRFLLYVKQHIIADYKDFICEAPYILERRLELTDLWIAGLQCVNAENLKIQTNEFDQSLLWCVSSALRSIFDERMIPVYHAIFDQANLVRDEHFLSMSEASRNLFYQGEPQSFSKLADKHEPSGALKIASEKEAAEWFINYIGDPRNDQFWYKIRFLKSWPILARGLIRHVLNDPGYQDIIYNYPADRFQEDYSFIYNIIKLGSSILSDEEIVKEIIKSEKSEKIWLASLWIEILGNRDSTVGNDLLMQLVEKKAGAARALGKRLLGKNRNDILKRIKELPEDQRSKLVGTIMSELSILPQVFSSNELDLSRDVLEVNPRQWRRASEQDNKYYAIYLQYEDKLHDWIQWAPSYADLSLTYIWMKSPEAQKRFMTLLKNSSVKDASSKIDLAWQYRKYPDKELLKELQQKFIAKEPESTFLQFMLSELGNDENYKSLKERIYLKELDADTVRFFDAMIKESSRRKDFSALLNEGLYLLEHPDPNNLIDNKLVSVFVALIKNKLKMALTLMNSMKLYQPKYQVNSLEACLRTCEKITWKISYAFNEL